MTVNCSEIFINMGLLTVLKKMKLKEKEMRILMLGLDNAGKTTILKRFNGEEIDTISPTLGFNIKTLEHRGYKLNVWDVGGQKSLRSYWRNYFESTDGLIWVVDSADKRRLDDCKQELHALLKEEVLELESIKTHHWKIVWCSAVTGQNLLEGINWLIDDIAARIFTLD
ncbi:ADP-ribosylation factor-like protein 2 [Blattella germanica]|nr:ADP-ribosylation factor-like protein 2 [Blattella germanica]